MTKRRLMQMVSRIPKGIERKEGKEVSELIAEIKAEIIAKIGEGDTRLTALQTQVDALDAKTQVRHTPDNGLPSGLNAVGAAIKEHKEGFDRHGRIRFDVPTLLPERK